MSILRILGYLAAVASGGLATVLLPDSLALPVFFGLLAACGLLLVASHTVHQTDKGPLSLGKVLAILSAVAGPSGIHVRSGRTPFYLDIALLVMLGYVGALCLR